MPFANQVEQGQALFLKETFGGNGRTCSTCHVPAENFSLSLKTINALSLTDPLFVAEFNLNTLTLSSQAEPSDLRGTLTAGDGSTATVLAGTGTSYLVYGGSSFTGQIVTDDRGNSAAVQSFTAGDLNGLEDPTQMHARALILENIDGFANPPNLRQVLPDQPVVQRAALRLER